MPSKHGRQHYGSKECERSLKEEALRYQALKVLQGKVIPRLIAHGSLLNQANDKIPFIAIERVMDVVPLNEAANSLAPRALERVAYRASDALQSLHQLGVAHGDLDNGGNNILVTPEGDVWLIDLGSAVMNASMETLQREERELRGLLREYQLKSTPFKYDHQEEPALPPYQPSNKKRTTMRQQALPALDKRHLKLPPSPARPKMIIHYSVTRSKPNPKSLLKSFK